MSKILIITNHSYMLYRFRLELIQALMKDHNIVLSMPFVGHENDFQALGLRCINTDVDRRGINPKTDFRLFLTYCRLLKDERPDLVITYSIKPNIYGGLACRIVGIPYCANVQGLGTAFQREGLAQFVTFLYRLALASQNSLFENRPMPDEFLNRHILPAGERLSSQVPALFGKVPLYSLPKNDAVHFLYLGRIMREKGMDELFAAAVRLHEEFGNKVVLDLGRLF